MELLVCPIEATVSLKLYQKSKDEKHLENVKEGLVEARDHLKHLQE